VGAPQEIVGGLLQVMVIGLFNSLPRDKHRVPPRLEIGLSYHFSQSAFHLVPGYGIAQPLAHHKSETVLVEHVRQDSNDQQVISDATSLLMNLGETLIAT
jgi:hypothetical protein